MPVSSSVVCESAASKCSTAIRDSLITSTTADNLTLSDPSNNLQNQFIASAKRALLENIEYEEAPPNFRNSIHDTLKSKYTVLNGTVPLTINNNFSNNQTAGSAIGKSKIISLLFFCIK